MYLELLKKALATETESVRMYAALLAIVPPEKIPVILEIFKDETDHQCKVADLLLEVAAGQSADQETLVPGVE